MILCPSELEAQGVTKDYSDLASESTVPLLYVMIMIECVMFANEVLAEPEH